MTRSEPIDWRSDNEKGRERERENTCFQIISPRGLDKYVCTTFATVPSLVQFRKRIDVSAITVRFDLGIDLRQPAKFPRQIHAKFRERGSFFHFHGINYRSNARNPREIVSAYVQSRCERILYRTRTCGTPSRAHMHSAADEPVAT